MIYWVVVRAVNSLRDGDWSARVAGASDAGITADTAQRMELGLFSRYTGSKPKPITDENGNQPTCTRTPDWWSTVTAKPQTRSTTATTWTGPRWTC